MVIKGTKSLTYEMFQSDMTNDNLLSQAFIESVAGFVAGVASTLVTHPLDLIKTRLQGKQLIYLVNSCNFSS